MPIDRRKTGEGMGHDTAYRTRNFHTHPTHVCIEEFCGFWSARIARSLRQYVQTLAILPFPERASSARGRW